MCVWQMKRGALAPRFYGEKAWGAHCCVAPANPTLDRYNEVTHESSWTDPTRRGEETPEAQHAALANLETGSRAHVSAPAMAAAAAGWQKLTDNSSGAPRDYWWNKVSGETSWDDPNVKTRKRGATTVSVV